MPGMVLSGGASTYLNSGRGRQAERHEVAETFSFMLGRIFSLMS
jgi:hypothetical protein